MGASVKIMLSYDYCHFEVCKSTDQPITDQEINELRKDVQRLADKAVKQYKIAKDVARRIEVIKDEKERHERKLNRIREKPEDAWTPEEKAFVKQAEDSEFQKQFEYTGYDYEDDWDDLEDEGDF